MPELFFGVNAIENLSNSKSNSKMKSALFLVALVLAMISSLEAFQSRQQHRRIKGERSSRARTSLDMTVLTYGGKKRNFAAGSPLKSAASALGVKPKYSCRK